MVTVPRALRVINPGLQSTVQDDGRRDVARFGVSPSGAADWFSARAANLLVGNALGEAVIETTLLGASFEVSCDARIAITGAFAPLTIEGVNADAWRSHAVRAGARISIGPAERGARSYVGIEGGVEVPLVLGSASTDLGAGFGGYQGRALRAGDLLDVGSASGAGGKHLAYPPQAIPAWDPSVTLRVLTGPNRSSLSERAWDELFARSYGVSSRSTRQGVQLEGDAIELERPTDIISAGAYAGCVQVTSAGLPVILLAEHQTTAGYATAACIIVADMPRAGQLRPGDVVRFALASQAGAVHALRGLQRTLDSADEC
jgi:antagonist of KipI